MYIQTLSPGRTLIHPRICLQTGSVCKATVRGPNRAATLFLWKPAQPATLAEPSKGHEARVTALVAIQRALGALCDALPSCHNHSVNVPSPSFESSRAREPSHPQNPKEEPITKHPFGADVISCQRCLERSKNNCRVYFENFSQVQ